MSKRKSGIKRAHGAAGWQPSRPENSGPRDSKAGSSGASLRRHLPSQAAIRETVESVVIAFVLAFLFRTFEAEAFVIPTGSMAPTLMGQHKDLNCDKCGYPYQVSASDEVDQKTGKEKGWEHQVIKCTCPMCRYTMDIGPRNPQHKSYPSFKGDRILVGKFAYQFNDPERWDVAVFRYPGSADTNYIKRLVGLPSETIRIFHGDIYVGRGESDGRDEFQIARKPPRKLLAVLQPVFDNDCMGKIAAIGFPPRWISRPAPDGSTADAWQPADDYRSYQTEGSADRDVWLRYQHLVPTQQQWQYVRQNGQPPPADPLAPQLISDFLAYDAGFSEDSLKNNPAAERHAMGLHWVGDLALACTLDVQSDEGRVVLELVKGGRRFQCRFDVKQGTATLNIDGSPTVLAADGRAHPYEPSAHTAVQGRGKHDVVFSNCDEQLLLWVDGREVQFGAETAYPPLGNDRPVAIAAGVADLDLAPVGIASEGAGLKVSSLKILRDIYYIAVGPGRFRRGDPTDFDNAEAALRVLHDPALWNAYAHLPEVVFPRLGADQFIAMGDNSAKSSDSRFWGAENYDFYVSRDLLIGKAFFIYWPHSWNWPVYFFPNFSRMRFVK